MKSAVLFAIMFGVSLTLLAEEDYEIRLNRPDKPGDQFKVFATGHSSLEMQFLSGADVMKEMKNDFSVEYEATRKVLAVEPAAGRPTKVRDTVAKAVVIRGKNRSDIAAKGAVLTASLENKKNKVEIDGRTVNPETAKLLEVVINLSRGGATDDEIFGTKGRKKPGDTWNINAVAAADDLARSDNIEMKKLAGEVKLDSVTHEASGDVLNITGHMAGDGRIPLPANITSIRGPFEVTFSGKFPTDLSVSRLQESIEMSIIIDASGIAPNGSPITVIGMLKRSMSSHTTPL